MNPLRGYRHFADDATPFTKVLLASFWLFTATFVPLAGQMIVLGWMALTLRQTVRGETGLASLDWDFDRLIFYLVLGAETALTLFVWTLPVTLLCVVLCVCSGSAFVMWGFHAAQSQSFTTLLLVLPFVYVFGLLLLVLVSLPGHVAALRVMLTGNLEEGFRFGEIMRFTGRYFLPLTWGLFVTWLVGIPLTLLGVLCCGVGSFPVYVLVHVSENDVLAQLYQRSLGEGFSPLTLGDDGPPPPVGVGPVPPSSV